MWNFSAEERERAWELLHQEFLTARAGRSEEEKVASPCMSRLVPPLPIHEAMLSLPTLHHSPRVPRSHRTQVRCSAQEDGCTPGGPSSPPADLPDVEDNWSMLSIDCVPYVKSQSTGEEEFEAYKALRLEARNMTEVLKPDVLQWWKIGQEQFPTIAPIARKFLALQGSSVAVERLFSRAGKICTDERLGMSPMLLEALIFLHENFDMIQNAFVVNRDD
jgi:hypothetical protein